MVNTSNIKQALSTALDWCENKTRISPAVADLAVYHGIKTAAYYIRVINQWIADLSRGDVTQDEFIDRFADLIEQQLTRAWNEGMRLAGADPSEMTEEMQAQLTEIIAQQYIYVDQFAADIASGKFSLAQLQARANMWANRYNEVMNEAKLASAEMKDKYIWVLGEAEHCNTCLSLSGIVAYASEWNAIGIRPQSDRLDCKGFNCACSLVPTDQRRSRDAYGQIEEALL